MQSRNVAYLPRIDHLRLLAALLVFAFHLFHFYVGGWQPHPDLFMLAPITEGHTGVGLFFVLSGFIFMTIAKRRGPFAYGAFLRNRLLRIAPLFLVVFMLALSIGRDAFEPGDLFYLAATNLGSAPTSDHFATGPAWSISIEFAFYLVFPFLAVFVRQEGAAYLIRLLALLAVLKLVAFLASANATHMLYSTLAGRMDQFVFGMIGALIFAARPAWLHRSRWPIVLAATAIVIALMVQARFASYFLGAAASPFWLFWGTLEGALWAGLVTAYCASPFRLPAMLDRLFATAGTWSFSLYMWHAMVIFAVHRLLVGDGTADLATLALHAPLIAALTFALAWLSWRTIEAPFLTLRGRYVEPAEPQMARAAA